MDLMTGLFGGLGDCGRIEVIMTAFISLNDLDIWDGLFDL